MFKFKEKINLDKVNTFICYLIPFLGLGGYFLSLVLTDSIYGTTGYYSIHYLYTYDHGFVARGLVGEVISWFCKTVSVDTIKNTVIIFSFLLMISASLCIGRAMSKVKNDRERLFIVFCLCFLVCILPGSFRYYYTDVKLDKLLWAITLFSMLLVDKKYGIWMVPVLCIVATLVNPIFLFCSMILIAIVLLQKFYENNFSAKNGVICAVSYLSMIALGVYALVSEKDLGFNTPRELVDYYYARFEHVLSEKAYSRFENEWLFDYFDTMEVVIQKAFQIYFIQWGNWRVCIADLIFLMIPTYFILGYFWKSCITSSENKFQKFIFFLCMISPIVILPPILFSWESSKYFINNLFVNFSLMIYFVVNGNGSVLKTIERTKLLIKSNWIFFVCLATYFTFLIINR